MIALTLTIPTQHDRFTCPCLPCGVTQHGYDYALRSFERDLVDAFGGFTAVEGQGAWVAPDSSVLREPVRVYTLACDDSDIDQLQALARLRPYVKTAFHQEAVYLTAAQIEGEAVA